VQRSSRNRSSASQVTAAEAARPDWSYGPGVSATLPAHKRLVSYHGAVVAHLPPGVNGDTETLAW